MSLAEMRRVARVIQQYWVGHRLERCVQPDGERVVLSLYGRSSEGESSPDENRKVFLLLCCQPDNARASRVERLPKAPQNPPAFVSWLRAHMKSARLISSSLISDDRLLALRFETREGEFQMILALFGARSNLYVTNEEGRVVALLRPASQTRTEIGMGDLFAAPMSGVPKSGTDRFAETSDERLLQAIESHYADEESTGEEAALIRRMRQSLKRERKNATRRLEKIEAELAEADRAPELQRHGDLLKGALGSVGKGDSEVRVHDYESDEEVVIPLDPKLDARENL
ncbi:MAG: NFACT family protein, partial [Myxococcota bacterium]|nr:NFACT family protein [Myxococcota bacterium]